MGVRLFLFLEMLPNNLRYNVMDAKILFFSANYAAGHKWLKIESVILHFNFRLELKTKD